MKHLVVFAKAPHMGKVKTRLAADIGIVAATTFYRHNLQSIFHGLGQDRRWRCWLAVSPDRVAHDRGFRGHGFWPSRIPLIPQGGGDLGARMGRIMKILPPGPAIIIGSDIPDIKADSIAAAFRFLGFNDAVFGPSADGGYWLVGLKRSPDIPTIFSKVRWSGTYALADTMANVGPETKVAMVDNMDDIDNGADYRIWRTETT